MQNVACYQPRWALPLASYARVGGHMRHAQVAVTLACQRVIGPEAHMATRKHIGHFLLGHALGHVVDAVPKVHSAAVTACQQLP